MTDSSRLRKNLRDHDRAVTTALESVSSLVNDAYQHPRRHGQPDRNVLTVAQIEAAQAIALSIRSLTAHLIVLTDEISSAGPHDPTVPPEPTAPFKHYAPGGSVAADYAEVPPMVNPDDVTGDFADNVPFTVHRERTTCPTCLDNMSRDPWIGWDPDDTSTEITVTDYPGQEPRILTVQESTLAREHKVWLGDKFGPGPGEPGRRFHLNENEARQVRDALNRFLGDTTQDQTPTDHSARRSTEETD